MELKDNQIKVRDVVAEHGTVTAREVADETGLGYSTVTGVLRELHEGGVIKRVEADDEEKSNVGAPVYWQIIVPDPPRRTKKPRPTAASTGVRFGKGELRARVLEALVKECPNGGDMSPTQIAHVIDTTRVGMMAGSCMHACEVLIEQGLVVKTSEKPRRYAPVR